MVKIKQVPTSSKKCKELRISFAISPRTYPELNIANIPADIVQSITSFTLCVKFYVTCIQSILLYACQVFHHSLLEYLSYSLEQLQKRALKIIYGYDISYEQALSLAGLDNLVDRRSQLCDTFFKNIISNPQGSLFNLISDVNDASVHLRHVRPFNLPICKTNRFKKIVY